MQDPGRVPWQRTREAGGRAPHFSTSEMKHSLFSHITGLFRSSSKSDGHFSKPRVNPLVCQRRSSLSSPLISGACDEE